MEAGFLTLFIPTHKFEGNEKLVLVVSSRVSNKPKYIAHRINRIVLFYLRSFDREFRSAFVRRGEYLLYYKI